MHTKAHDRIALRLLRGNVVPGKGIEPLTLWM